MPPEFVPTTRGQRERVEAQTGGRRGSTRTRSDQDPRGMYGPREQTGTVTVDLGGDRGTREVATYGGPTQQGMPTGSTGFDSGYGEKAGTLSFQEFMNVTGRSETNPYGKQGFFSRVFGIDPSKINYAASTPGGIATLNKVNALAYDQYLNPRDARGNIRGFLREGSPTRFGTVVNDPTLEKDLGIMGAIPYIGGFLRAANRRSALNISPYDNPLFSEMGDLGNELGEFPEGSVAAAPVAQAAPTSAVSGVFEPFTTDPEERNFIEEDFVEANRRATDEDSPFSRPVPESTYRPIFTDDVTVADVIAAEPVAGSVLVSPRPTVTTPETENQRIMRERQEAFDAAMRRRQQESSAFMDRTNETLDEILRKGDTIVTPGVRGGATEPQVSDILSPENIAEILELPGRNPNAPLPLDIIPPSLLVSR